MDLLLEDCGQDLPARHRVVKRLADAYGKEFGVRGATKAEILKRYRERRRSIDELLQPGTSDGHPLAAGLDALSQRSTRLAATFQELRERSAAGRLGRPLPEVAESLLHMHANRLLRSAARAQEAVLYTFLERSYASALARSGRPPA
jgi:thiopeptide-type bacteriocin biosynthesis protein